MLRITEETTVEGSKAVLRLEGQVAGLWVDELRREFSGRRRSGGLPVFIDLEHVSFIDHRGIEFFDEVATEIQVINCSLFAAEQLKGVLLRYQVVRR
jgi:anti-anti-sigma regulatory factor